MFSTVSQYEEEVESPGFKWAWWQHTGNKGTFEKENWGHLPTLKMATKKSKLSDLEN